jgi:hypothetical protein
VKDLRTLTSVPPEELGALADESLRRMEWNSARRAGKAPLFSCVYCKKEFKPSRWWQLFCSPNCRVNHFWDKRTKERVQDLRALKEALE